MRTSRFLIVILTALTLACAQDLAFAQGKGKDKDRGQQDQGRKAHKQHKHHDGKALVGDKIKVNGRHKFHENGKFSSFVDVSNGKIAGVSVKHAEKGDVPVKKYKTSRKMVEAPASGFQTVSLILAQGTGTEYLGTKWIGYSYTDDYGDEVIYWFPYDMILDLDTGAVEYVPAD